MAQGNFEESKTEISQEGRKARIVGSVFQPEVHWILQPLL